MGDHWKSLAQKLGAPGIDDPTPSIGEQAAAVEPIPTATWEEVARPAAVVQQVVAAQLESAVEPLAEVMTPAHEPEVVDDKPRKKSSWESLASMFNIQLDRTPPAAPAIKASAPTQPVASRDRETRPATPREKPRFNEPRREREPDRRESETRLQVFPESRGAQENPALEELFAEAPRGDLDSWKKPPRVIDDLSWDEIPPASPLIDVEPEFISEAFDSDADPLTDDKVEGAERPARRRRRRRGPRRPEGSEPVTSRVDRDLDDVDSAVSSDEYSEPDTFEVDLAGSDELVADVDPERRSNRKRRRGRKRPSDESIAPTHADTRDEDGELNAERASERPGDRPERLPRPDRSPARSSERVSDRPDRPAERSRGRTSESSPERTADRNPDRSSERGSERNAERSDRPERSERTGDRPRRAERAPESRREPRTERPEPRADRPPRVREERPLPPRSDIEEIEEIDEVDELEDLDSGDVGEKHRNIPSWADSLHSIIEGNMENHKRNDNRGGPPRGRPVRAGRPFKRNPTK